MSNYLNIYIPLFFLDIPQIIVTLPDITVNFPVNLDDYTKISVQYTENFDNLMYTLFIRYKNNIVAKRSFNYKE